MGPGSLPRSLSIKWKFNRMCHQQRKLSSALESLTLRDWRGKRTASSHPWSVRGKFSSSGDIFFHQSLVLLCEVRTCVPLYDRITDPFHPVPSQYKSEQWSLRLHICKSGLICLILHNLRLSICKMYWLVFSTFLVINKCYPKEYLHSVLVLITSQFSSVIKHNERKHDQLQWPWAFS